MRREELICNTTAYCARQNILIERPTQSCLSNANMDNAVRKEATGTRACSTLVVDDERRLVVGDVELAASHLVALQSFDLQLQDVVVQLVLLHLECVRLALPCRVAVRSRRRQHVDVHGFPAIDHTYLYFEPCLTKLSRHNWLLC